MPELVSNQDHENGERFRFIFNLISVERPEAWEGWLVYEISLITGSDVVITSSQLTMMDDEILRLCEVLEGSVQAEFEPMEPDFQLIFRTANPRDAGENYEVFIFMNEALRRGGGFYSTDGLGLKFSLEKSICREFAAQLRVQHAKLTVGVQRERRS